MGEFGACSAQACPGIWLTRRNNPPAVALKVSHDDSYALTGVRMVQLLGRIVLMYSIPLTYHYTVCTMQVSMLYTVVYTYLVLLKKLTVEHRDSLGRKCKHKFFKSSFRSVNQARELKFESNFGPMN